VSQALSLERRSNSSVVGVASDSANG